MNVSVRGGRRVEIKGVPQAGWAPRLVHGEAWRQVNLLRLRDELHRARLPGRRTTCGSRRPTSPGFVGSSSLAPLRPETWELVRPQPGPPPGLRAGRGSVPRPRGAPARPRRDALLAHAARAAPSPTSSRAACGSSPASTSRPILFHSEAWPREARERPRAACARPRGAATKDALVVVWGPERDVRTAAEEIRLRYVDATDGVPNETRQPFADGSTDFERILPGPDRMYPDTDSPAHAGHPGARRRGCAPRSPSARGSARRATRRRACPVPTVHYLIRRGGAALVDRVVSEAGADLRSAAFFFGERLKGLRRAGVAGRPAPRGALGASSSGPSRRARRVREAWAILVRRVAARPGDDGLAGLLGELGLDGEPAGLAGDAARAGSRRPRSARPTTDDPGRVLRHATGQVMRHAARARARGRRCSRRSRAAAEVRR